MSTTDRAPRYVFIVGSGRCGSSLVQEVLARHPGIGFISNVDDRVGVWSGGRINNLVYRHVPPARTQKGRVRYAPSEAYRIIAREVSPLVASPGRPLGASDATPWLAARFEQVFARRAATQGRPVFLHKFTGWPRVGFIDAVMPDAHFVNVVRDGRAVASSLVQMPWWNDHEKVGTFGLLSTDDVAAWEESGRSFVLLAGLVWKAVVDAHDASRRAIDRSRWLEVRYEDVLADPRSSFAAMLDFAGLEWDARFERQFGRQPITSSRRAAYSRDLAPHEVALLERHLSSHLERYGYSCAAAGATAQGG